VKLVLVKLSFFSRPAAPPMWPDQSAIGVDMDSSKQAASSQLDSRLLLPGRTVVQKHCMA